MRLFFIDYDWIFWSMQCCQSLIAGNSGQPKFHHATMSDIATIWQYCVVSSAYRGIIAICSYSVTLQCCSAFIALFDNNRCILTIQWSRVLVMEIRIPLVYLPAFYAIIFIQCDGFRVLMGFFLQFNLGNAESFLLKYFVQLTIFPFEVFCRRMFCPLTKNFYILSLFSSSIRRHTRAEMENTKRLSHDHL